MRTLLVVLFSTITFAAQAQTNNIFKAEHNEYGEVKTSLQHASLVESWPKKILQANKDTLIKRIGEGMYYEIFNNCEFSVWPPVYSLRFLPDRSDPNTMKYTLWFIAGVNDYAIVRIRAKDNSSLPSNYQRKDGTDFYWVMHGNGVMDYTECKKALKNSAAKYPESAYARNMKTTDAPGSEEFTKGYEASQKKDYENAEIWYVKAAEKGSVTAMYNLGIMYYNNRIHKAYDNQALLDEALNPGSTLKKRMLKACDWFKKAADKGDEKAMYAIGLMYKNGEGVDKSLAEARKWFQKAADKGDADAKEELKKL